MKNFTLQVHTPSWGTFRHVQRAETLDLAIKQETEFWKSRKSPSVLKGLIVQEFVQHKISDTELKALDAEENADEEE